MSDQFDGLTNNNPDQTKTYRAEEWPRLVEEIRLLRRAVYLYERDVVPGYQLTVIRAGGNYQEGSEVEKDWDEVRDLVSPIAIQVRLEKEAKWKAEAAARTCGMFNGGP